jgi:hypothetical protein
MYKQTLISNLRKFARQRPGLEFGNYGDAKSYRAEMRAITRDLAHAETLLRAVQYDDSISARDIIDAAQSAFSGRLTITPVYIQNSGLYGMAPEVCRYDIGYCTGQYFPTEYRKAVCAVLASALWEHWRGHCMPAPFTNIGTGDDQWYALRGTNGLMKPVSGGEWLRSTFRSEFGRAIASRYFN